MPGALAALSLRGSIWAVAFPDGRIGTGGISGGAYGEVPLINRKKNMIKSGGANIASVRVEEALLARPAVLHAAVIGPPNPQWSEAVCAFVKLRPGTAVDEAGPTAARRSADSRSRN